jgi:hypothetical protein
MFGYPPWMSLVGLTAGMLVIGAPFVLSKSFRSRFERANVDLETIGWVAIALALVVIGVYNNR